MPSLLAAGDIRLTIFESKRMEPVASVSSSAFLVRLRGRTLLLVGPLSAPARLSWRKVAVNSCYRGVFSDKSWPC